MLIQASKHVFDSYRFIWGFHFLLGLTLLYFSSVIYGKAEAIRILSKVSNWAHLIAGYLEAFPNVALC